MIISNSMQYLPVYNKNYNSSNLFPTPIRLSNNSLDNYDSQNIIYSKNIIHRKNSAVLLTAHNNNFENLFSSNTSIETTQINKPIYNPPIYSNGNINISSIEQNYEPQMTKVLRRYHSSQNLNILNIPSITAISEQGTDISNLNSLFDILDNKVLKNRNQNKVVSNIKKSKISKIPHPKFQKKKLFPQNQININKENIININYNTPVYSDQNISDNIIINDSLNNFANNNINSIEADNYNIETNNFNIEVNNYNPIYIEEEPPMNFKLSEFIILNQIGHGGEGSIFVVNWEKNNKNYALKKCEFIYEETAKKRKSDFLKLKEFIESNGCDGIIKTYGILCEKNDFGTHYYYELMELAEKDWEQEIINRQKMKLYYQEYELMEIFRLLIKTFSSLQTIHYTHRDIKPQNIMLVNGQFKICDFGNGRFLKREGYVIQKIRGSELFMSPIVFKGYRSGMPTIKHNTFKSDVFSLGMCFFFAASLTYNCLNKIRELYDMNAIKKIINENLSKRYSQNLIDLIFTMLQVEESKRPDFKELEILLSF